MVDDAWDRAVVLHQEGRLRDAEAAYREVVLDGDDGGWLGIAAVLLQEGGRDDEADVALAALLESEDDTIAAWAGELLGGRRFWVHGDADGARAALRVAIARGDEDDVRAAAAMLGDMEASLGREDEALGAYAVFTRSMARRWDSEFSEEAFDRMARARMAQWRRPRTRAVAQRVRRWTIERRRRGFVGDWSPPSDWLSR